MPSYLFYFECVYSFLLTKFISCKQRWYNDPWQCNDLSFRPFVTVWPFVRSFVCCERYNSKTYEPVLPRDARPMHKRGHGVKTPWRDAVMRCQCVCPSVTFVSCVKTNKHIFEIFSPLGSHTILVFPYQTGWRYSDGNPPNEGVECRWGRQKTRFWTNISLRCVQVYSVVNRRESTRTVKNKAATDGGECQAEAAEHSRFRRGCSHKTTTKCL